MASRSGREGMFLKASDRESLLFQFAKFEKKRRQQQQHPAHALPFYESDEDADDDPQHQRDGCRVCKKDNDHTNMLLCEMCNAEYHFYCIGLRAVPTEDWFCNKCRPAQLNNHTNSSHEEESNDGLDFKVAALPPGYTSRFGEVVWAQGGPGYGWWPCYVYDPRMTVGGARDLAKKQLGHKHLVYFFQCLEAPFAALPDTKVCEWYTGLTENYHLGKAAKHASRNRGMAFMEALKIATLELSKPIEHRMDWNHPDPVLASPIGQELLESGKKRRRRRPKSVEKKNKKRLGVMDKEKELQGRITVSRKHLHCSVRTNLLAALQAHNNAVICDDEDEMDTLLYIRVMCGPQQPPTNVGFTQFGTRKHSTFADARRAIAKDLDYEQHPWKFYIPELGPISAKQEDSLGAIVPFQQRASTDLQLGDGTIRKPIKVLIIKTADLPLLVEPM